MNSSFITSRPGLRLCCSQTTEDRFSRVEAHFSTVCLVLVSHYKSFKHLMVTAILKKTCLLIKKKYIKLIFVSCLVSNESQHQNPELRNNPENIHP